MWSPQLDHQRGALYEQIADALALDIAQGRLAPGTRLPTLKALAAALAITPGTVNRAYELAQRRGLITGTVGRGTFVSADAPVTPTAPAPRLVEPSPTPPPPRSVQPALDEATCDLAVIKPNVTLHASVLKTTLAELTIGAESDVDWLDYTPDGGLLRHRQAGAAWISQSGLPAVPEHVVLTAGAQHGLWVVINALTRPGDLVLCEAWCYPGVAALALSLGRRLRGVALDDEGMNPEALRRLCEQERPALVICIATHQNPCATVMSPTRRQAIAALARHYDFALLDDDLYGFLAPQTLTPLAHYAPERSVYLTSLSKSVSAALRLGYLHSPPAWVPRLAAAVRTSVWMVSPLAAELASRVITSGQAAQLAVAQRDEARVRQALAAEILHAHTLHALPTGFHVWLALPASWRSGDQFAAVARRHHVVVSGGEVFRTDPAEGVAGTASYVRLALMAPSREQLTTALSTLAGLLDTQPTDWF